MPEKEPGRGDPLGPVDWRKMFPFEQAAARDRPGWMGLGAAHYRPEPAFERNVPALTHHRLFLVIRPPEELDVRYEGVKRHVPPPPERSCWCRPAARPGRAPAGTRTRCTSSWSRGWSRGSPPRRSASTRRG